MDKSRDARRVLRRYSELNRINNKKKLVISELSGKGAVFAVQPRREKRRRLSLVGISGGGGCEDVQGTEMGSSKSDGQDDELPFSNVSAKKLKPQKKIYEDCNGVNRASIPRKLRSVIKNRTCHTISDSLATKKDCTKRPKSGMFNPERLSKDEEEVAEALYALAGIGPHKATSFENKLDGESPSEEQMHSKKLDNSMLSSQGPRAPKETCNQTSKELSKQIMEVDELRKSTSFSQPKLSTTLNLNASLQVNHQSLTKQNDIQGREVLTSQGHFGNNVDLRIQDKHERALTEGKKNGSTLLPSLHFQSSHSSGAHDGFPSQYSVTKLPYWLHTVASSSEPRLHQSQVTHKNESKVEKWSRRIKNRSPTHVYISNFIQLSQKPQGKEISLLESPQFKTSDVPASQVLKISSHPSTVINKSTKLVPDSHPCSSTPGKNILDASNDTTMTLGRCSHGQEQSPSEHGNSTFTKKRSFDFLTLSTQESGTEPRVNATNRNRIPLAGLPVSQLQPLARYDSASAFPFPPNFIQSNTYQSMPSASAKLPIIPQLPPYFSRLDSSATYTTKQPMWMTQPTTQYMSPSQIAYWQNSRQEQQIVQYTHAQIPPSQSSLSSGGNFPRYLQFPSHSQQNHQMLRVSAPFPPIQANSQHSPVPIWCDKSGS